MDGFENQGTEDLQDGPREEGGIVAGALFDIPPGEYPLHYIDYATASAFGQPKVVVNFGIGEPSEYAGVPISRYYNAKALSGPLRRYGDYVAAANGDLVREYRSLMLDPKRLDRISWNALKGKLVLGEVRTVGRDSKGCALPRGTGYSVVSRLLRILPELD